MKTLISGLFALTVVFACGQNRQIEFRKLSWQETLEASKTENKPIFMDCYTVWCGPCKWMSANIFTRDDVADYFNEEYICVKFDMEKGEGLEIAKEFGIRAYPTLLYLSGDKEILLKAVGASRNPEDYVNNGKKAKDPKANMPYYMNNKEENFDDPAFMKEYFSIMAHANMVDAEEANKYLQQFPAEEWASDDNWTIIRMTIQDPSSEAFQYMLKNEKTFTDKYGDEALSFMSDILYYDLMRRAYRAKTDEQKAEYEEYKTEVLNSGFSNIEYVEFQVESFEYKRAGDWDAYCKLNVENGDQYIEEDAEALNSIAWDFYENTTNPDYLAQALKWAEKAVELDDAHHIMDTYASLLYATGDLAKALEVEEEALKKAHANGENGESYQKLIDQIKGEL